MFLNHDDRQKEPRQCSAGALPGSFLCVVENITVRDVVFHVRDRYPVSQVEISPDLGVSSYFLVDMCEKIDSH